MSGLEIAGVVLGSVPLLISALEHYADGIRTIKSIVAYKALVENLALDFRVVNSGYRRGCERLLVRLRIEPDDIDELLSDPKGAKWSDPELDRELQRLLKEDYVVYKRLVSRVFQRLDRFSDKLGLKDDFKVKLSQPHYTFRHAFASWNSLSAY
jgi:hypothetical protein